MRARAIQKELNATRVNITLKSKRIEQELKVQLLEILNKELLENDSLQVEVDENNLAYFINILSDKEVNSYEYEQVNKTCFNFYPKDLLA